MENQKTYNSHVKTVYIDWLTTTKEGKVECYFAIVDNESAMYRAEGSKVSVSQERSTPWSYFRFRKP